jgi:Xaa-Pro aminopeptidase
MMIDYKARRQKFANQLPVDAIAIIPGAFESIRNGDVHYRFCQDSDFFYLTGFEEPHALLIVTSGKQSESILFNQPRVLAEEQWTGSRLGQDDASHRLQVDKAFSIHHLQSRLPELLMNKQAIYYPLGKHPVYEKMVFEAWEHVKGKTRKGILAPQMFVDIAPMLGEMRLIKDAFELSCMREAARISIAGHRRMMERCRHLKTEYELEAEFLYEITRQGCRGLAYDSIVAGGVNACTLHYTANNQQLKSGELVLVDAGGEYQHYAADITRTYPVNGRFTTEQRLIYELVLRAQRAGIDCIKPGAFWHTIQETMVRILTEGLVELNILQGPVEQLIENEAYKPLYMHSSGHWLGLDVHDVGAYKENGSWRTLKPGMVLTVEPGLYISPELEQIDSRWKGIGVRIEDDIHVTADGYENLTAALPVHVDALEDLVRG